MTMLLAVTGVAEAITIDGDLGDWGSPWFTDNTATPGYWQSTPIFTGYVTNDTTNLYVALDVETSATDKDDIPVWLAFKTTAGKYSQFIAPYSTMEIGYADEPYAATNDPLSSIGGDFASVLGGGHLYYELQVPLSVLGASPGDTLKYLTHVRDFSGSPTVTNYHPEAYSWSPYSALQTYGGDLTLVPEPATIGLLGLGALSLLRRKR